MAANDTAGMSATLMKQYWHEKFLTELRSKLHLRELGVMGKVPAGQGICNALLPLNICGG